MLIQIQQNPESGAKLGDLLLILESLVLRAPDDFFLQMFFSDQIIYESLCFSVSELATMRSMMCHKVYLVASDLVFETMCHWSLTGPCLRSLPPITIGITLIENLTSPQHSQD